MGQSPNLYQVVLNLIYPPSCFHCRASMQQPAYFCKECLVHLTLLLLEGHCIKCFCSISLAYGTCKTCRKQAHPFRRQVSCFDAYGPGKTLLNLYLQRKSKRLARDLTSYLIIQLDKLNLPALDLITTVPGYFKTPFAPIAKELAKLLNIPYQKTLSREISVKPTFHMKKKCSIINKSVLLLTSHMEEREEMRAAAFSLLHGLPQTIYGMTFCATL